jgi:hypothetical protein
LYLVNVIPCIAFVLLALSDMGPDCGSPFALDCRVGQCRLAQFGDLEVAEP